jgi:hypothetical protein
MAAIRLRLLKSYKHKYKLDAWPIGQVVQVDNILANELLADKIAELYEGEYPPKQKVKTDFFKPKN